MNRKLVLKNLNKADSGDYECFLTNGEREIVKLEVHGQYFKPKENTLNKLEMDDIYEIVKGQSPHLSQKQSFYFTSNFV